MWNRINSKKVYEIERPAFLGYRRVLLSSVAAPPLRILRSKSSINQYDHGRQHSDQYDHGRQHSDQYDHGRQHSDQYDHGLRHSDQYDQYYGSDCWQYACSWR